MAIGGAIQIPFSKPGAMMKKTKVEKGPIAKMGENLPQLQAVRNRLQGIGQRQSMNTKRGGY